MNDIKQWIDRVETARPPEQWVDIEDRASSFRRDEVVGAPRSPERGRAPERWKKVAVIAVAFALTAAATGTLVRVFRRDGSEGPPLPRPLLLMSNGDIWVAQGTGESGYTILAVDPVTGNGRVLWSDGSDATVPQSKVHPAAVGTDYSFSPDGTKVVFSGGSETDPGAIELFVMNADGSALRQLTHDGGVDEWPAWSPDGRSIAYVDDRPSRIAGCISPGAFCAAHLNILDLATAATRRITDSAVDWAPSWSPDGTKLVFVVEASDGSGMLEVIHADGSDPTELGTAPGGFLSWPAWSPDGSKILFLRLDRVGGTTHLWTIAPEGTDARDLFETNFGRPIWSPDSTEIVYLRYVAGDAQIWLVGTDGTGDRPLAAIPHQSLSPIAWQPVLPTSTTSPSIADVPSVIGLTVPANPGGLSS